MSLMGNVQNARSAVMGHLKFIGSGCTRSVYADSDFKYVYKVSPGSGQYNIAEHLMFQAMKGVPKVAKFAPKSRLIEVLGEIVLVMPYLPGDVYDSDRDYRRLEEYLARDCRLMFDLAPFNMRRDENGRLFIIDAGEMAWEDTGIDEMILWVQYAEEWQDHR